MTISQSPTLEHSTATSQEQEASKFDAFVDWVANEIVNKATLPLATATGASAVAIASFSSNVFASLDPNFRVLKLATILVLGKLLSALLVHASVFALGRTLPLARPDNRNLIAGFRCILAGLVFIYCGRTMFAFSSYVQQVAGHVAALSPDTNEDFAQRCLMRLPQDREVAVACAAAAERAAWQAKELADKARAAARTH